jgi:DNA-binding CsgD family transcriptional regulator
LARPNPGQAILTISRDYYEFPLPRLAALRNADRIQQINTVIHDRIHFTLKQELQLLAVIIRDYTDDEYTYEQIAHMMSVHRRTVDGYRESIFDKFGIKSKTGLVLFMVRNGLLEELQKTK